MFVNPTGGTVRMDAAGSGLFGSARGARLHDGVDLSGVPGQKVRMPFTGIITRLSYPYEGDSHWCGVKIVGPRCTAKLWYMLPLPGVLGKQFEAGEDIGLLQDITKKYEHENITPHIHFKIEKIDPVFLLFPYRADEERNPTDRYVRDARVAAVGWAYADCCVTLDKGEDPHHVHMPDVLGRMEKDFADA